MLNTEVNEQMEPRLAGQDNLACILNNHQNSAGKAGPFTHDRKQRFLKTMLSFAVSLGLYSTQAQDALVPPADWPFRLTLNTNFVRSGLAQRPSALPDESPNSR